MHNTIFTLMDIIWLETDFAFSLWFCPFARCLSFIEHIPHMMEKEMATHSSILSGKLDGLRILVGCSSRGHKETDITKWLNHRHTQGSMLSILNDHLLPAESTFPTFYASFHMFSVVLLKYWVDYSFFHFDI